MDPNELKTQKRLLDLSRTANRKNIVTFSSFLNLHEQSLFHQITADLETSYRLFGGYEFAERQMIAFIPDALSYADDIAFPIVCLRFFPVHPKFAEELSHRDVLGALMNLGIDRARIGDIKLDGQDAFLFCEEGISEYLLQSLSKIRNTIVTGERSVSAHPIEQKFEHLEGIIASGRLDAVVALLTKKSRNQSALFIRSQKVFINACIVTSNSYECKAGDIISIRGYGKFLYEGIDGETRKGRSKVSIKKYL